MAYPQMARITCIECNARCNSERELRDHMQMAHRRCCSVLAEQENEMDDLCGRTPAEQHEEYTRPDEETEAGGEA
jgi:hypothetical protein